IELLRDQLKKAQVSATQVFELREQVLSLEQELADRPDAPNTAQLEEIARNAQDLSEERASLQARVAELEANLAQASLPPELKMEDELRAAWERIADLERALSSRAEAAGPA